MQSKVLNNYQIKKFYSFFCASYAQSYANSWLLLARICFLQSKLLWPTIWWLYNSKLRYFFCCCCCFFFFSLNIIKIVVSQLTYGIERKVNNFITSFFCALEILRAFECLSACVLRIVNIKPKRVVWRCACVLFKRYQIFKMRVLSLWGFVVNYRNIFYSW